MSTDTVTFERTGVLLVHGIGEQTCFQHLEDVVRDVAEAYQRRFSHEHVQVIVNSARSAPYDSPQEIWDADNQAPVSIDLVPASGQNARRIEFREVWWADLDEPTSWWVQVKFWLWGFSMWTAVQDHPGGTAFDGMAMPSAKRRHRAWARVQLFAIGVIFMLILGSASVAEWVLRRLGVKAAITETLVAYLGDIKLYQEARRDGYGPLMDLSAAPRITIRRRMIRALVDMAAGAYEGGWFVLAHSLGTIVAFNGLMEPEETLWRYLDEKRWTLAKAKGLTKPAPAQQPSDAGLDVPAPAPVWNPGRERVGRAQLFERLRGLMTYGSPLDKFATLFPRIVMVNTKAGLPDTFRWVNIYDPDGPGRGWVGFLQCGGTPSAERGVQGDGGASAQPHRLLEPPLGRRPGGCGRALAAEASGR